MAVRFTFRQLEYLVAVGEAGTIAQAAQQLNVSSPSISTAINQLEGLFGIQLFVRHHAQGLSLTPGGRRLVGNAKRLLSDAAALNDIASDVAKRPGGPISIGVLTTIAPLVSAQFRKSFETAYPEAQVTLHTGDQAALLTKLARAEIDIAITYDLEIPRDIHFEALIALKPYVMLPENHPMTGQKDVSLSEIAPEPLVLLDLPLSRDYFLSTFQAIGVTPNIADRTTDLSVARSLVANGFGYSMLNIGTRNTHALDGQPLAIRPIREQAPQASLGLATNQVLSKSGLVTAFFDHTRALIRDRGLPQTIAG
ncbi:MAG: LysR family transcriptional regulator [Pseudomonadota bacterium]